MPRKRQAEITIQHGDDSSGTKWKWDLNDVKILLDIYEETLPRPWPYDGYRADENLVLQKYNSHPDVEVQSDDTKRLHEKFKELKNHRENNVKQINKKYTALGYVARAKAIAGKIDNLYPPKIKLRAAGERLRLQLPDPLSTGLGISLPLQVRSSMKRARTESLEKKIALGQNLSHTQTVGNAALESLLLTVSSEIMSGRFPSLEMGDLIPDEVKDGNEGRVKIGIINDFNNATKGPAKINPMGTFIVDPSGRYDTESMKNKDIAADADNSSGLSPKQQVSSHIANSNLDNKNSYQFEYVLSKLNSEVIALETALRHQMRQGILLLAELKGMGVANKPIEAGNCECSLQIESEEIANGEFECDVACLFQRYFKLSLRIFEQKSKNIRVQAEIASCRSVESEVNKSFDPSPQPKEKSEDLNRDHFKEESLAQTPCQKDGNLPVDTIEALLLLHRLPCERQLSQTVNIPPSRLMKAVCFGELRTLLQVLDDPVISKEEIDFQDENGDSALLWAVQMEREDLVNLLLERGANVNTQTKCFWTALMFSCLVGTMSIARQLIDKGASINHTDSFGVSALLIATSRGHSNLTELLLEHAADPYALLKCGVKPIDAALFTGCDDLFNVLKNIDATVLS